MSEPKPVRNLKYFEALREAASLAMHADPNVYLIGLGVPDPKGVFGTTTGLAEEFGPKRVLDMPTSESAMTGLAIGSALTGGRPVMSHQRLDFALTCVEQIVNQAAKWHYMFGGRASVPLTVRMIIGRGWGQGPQHSQSLHSWFAHIPGLKVVMPSTPADAKGLLMQSIEDDDPVIFLEHRWLHNISGPVPEGRHVVPIGKGRVARQGTDVTLVGISYMTLECLKAAELLEAAGISAEVIDVRSLRPFDDQIVLESVAKTGRLLVADTSWETAGFSAEIIACVAEKGLSDLKAPPRRIALPDAPSPTSPALSAAFYPQASDVATAAARLIDANSTLTFPENRQVPLDVPDPSFTGPF